MTHKTKARNEKEKLRRNTCSKLKIVSSYLFVCLGARHISCYKTQTAAVYFDFSPLKEINEKHRRRRIFENVVRDRITVK